MDVVDNAIVVGVDGAEASERAALWAARQAAVFGEPLVLVHAVRWSMHTQAHLHAPVPLGAIHPGVGEEPVRQWARDVLDGLAERCRAAAGVEVRTEVASGDPADAVILGAERVAFVAVGHSERGGVARFLLGSTAERLTRACPWPVVVVRDGVPLDGRHTGAPVVVGVDGTPVSGRAVRFAFGFAARHDAEVVVVHASSGEVTTEVEPVETHEEAALREGTGPVGTELVECARRHPAVRYRLVHAAAPPVDALLAASAGAGLLVVGSHGKGAVRRTLLGSVSHEVIDHAPCPVAVLPPRTADARER
ncbi:universal stress protein [Saccharothrix yanglingensis]|uniref:universal stress protein n=1 Tax=Saccharothrix yanglingensis TaxID=659496 RepID=UPI0027D28D3D|nr:universal stress protein [Saccharothrix yanglingensis]